MSRSAFGCAVGAVALALAAALIVGATPPSSAFASSRPAVAHIVPSSGPSGGGNTVTISGHSFVNVTKVTFGTKLATNVKVTAPTRITATAPAGSGSVHVCVTTAAGVSAALSTDRYIYAAPPTITGISPSRGPSAGDTLVSITGTHLSGATAVKFGTESATLFVVNSATSISAVAPAQAAGTVDVKVTTAGGTISATGGYTYVAPPTITGISPARGGSAGGTLVSITGAHFSGATAVLFGSAPATLFVVNSATSISAVAPAQAAGSVDVVVVTLGGTATATDGYTYTSS